MVVPQGVGHSRAAGELLWSGGRSMRVVLLLWLPMDGPHGTHRLSAAVSGGVVLEGKPGQIADCSCDRAVLSCVSHTIAGTGQCATLLAVCIPDLLLPSPCSSSYSSSQQQAPPKKSADEEIDEMLAALKKKVGK